MYQTRRPLPAPGLSGPLLALARFGRVLLGAALLAGALLLGLILMTALLLRRAFKGRRATAHAAQGWAETARPSPRRSTGEVVDVEAREIRSTGTQ
ncbi:MAG: hypothetical protein IV094_12050 [Vitreoscilla sp.]|nr:hypothetical protein [Vitreoscilla sp.]